MPSLLDLLLPRTDAGVLVQFIAAGLVYPPLIWFGRRNRDIMLFFIGLCVFTFAIFGLRMVH